MDGRSAGFFQGLFKFFWETFPFWFPGGRVLLVLLTVAFLVIGLLGGAWDLAVPAIGLSLLVAMLLLPLLDWWLASPPPVPWDGWKLPETLEAALTDETPEARWQKGTALLWASIEQELLSRGNAASSELIWLERTLFFLTANQLFQAFGCMKGMETPDLLVMLRLLAARPWVYAEVLRALQRSNLVEAFAALIGAGGVDSDFVKKVLTAARENPLLSPPPKEPADNETTRRLEALCASKWYAPSAPGHPKAPGRRDLDGATPGTTPTEQEFWIVQLQGKQCWEDRPAGIGAFLKYWPALGLRHLLLFYFRLAYWRILPRKWVLRFSHHAGLTMLGVLCGLGLALICVGLILVPIPTREVKLHTFECTLRPEGDGIEFWKWKLSPIVKTAQQGAFLVETNETSLIRDCLWPLSVHPRENLSARHYPILIQQNALEIWPRSEAVNEWTLPTGMASDSDLFQSLSPLRGILYDKWPKTDPGKQTRYGPLDLLPHTEVDASALVQCGASSPSPGCRLAWPVRLSYLKMLQELSKLDSETVWKERVDTFELHLPESEKKAEHKKRLEQIRHGTTVGSARSRWRKEFGGLATLLVTDSTAQAEMKDLIGFYDMLDNLNGPVSPLALSALLTGKTNLNPIVTLDVIGSILRAPALTSCTGVQGKDPADLVKRAFPESASLRDSFVPDKNSGRVADLLQPASFFTRGWVRALTRCLVAGQASVPGASPQKLLAELEEVLLQEVYKLPTHPEKLALRHELATLILAQALFEWLNTPDSQRRLIPAVSESGTLYDHSVKGLTLRLEATALAVAMQKWVETSSRWSGAVLQTTLWEQLKKTRNDSDPYQKLVDLAEDDPVQVLLRYGVSEFPQDLPSSAQGAVNPGGVGPGGASSTASGGGLAPTPPSTPGPSATP